MDKEVSETRQTERGKPHDGATKKREISRTSLSINLHFRGLSYKKVRFKRPKVSAVRMIDTI